MPAAIPILVSAAASAAEATALTSFVFTASASLVVGAYTRDRAESKAKKAAAAAEEERRNAYNESLADRLITVRSAVATRKYVLGTVRLGGTLMYANTIGEHQVALDSIVAYSANHARIVGYFLDDEYVDAGDFPGPKYGYPQGLWTAQQFTRRPGTGPQTFTLDHEPLPGSVTAAAFGGPSGIVLGGYTVSGRNVTFPDLSSFSQQIEIGYTWRAPPRIYAQFRNGTDVNAPTDWGADYPNPDWDPSHLLRGVSYLRTLMLWDENVFARGAPQVGLVLAGGGIDAHALYDPRTGTYPAATANPALLAYWWMRLPRSRGGMGIPDSWIDLGSVITAANICDEPMQVRTLDGSGYEWIARYECNTVLDTANSPESNLEVILDAMAGRKVFTAGKYRIVAGAFRPATRTLTDVDVVGEEPLSVVTSSVRTAPPNVATARFADARQNWVETSPQPVRNQAYIDADGAESPIDLNLVATTDARRARYLMGIALETGRPAFACTVTVGGIGEDLALLDTVELSIGNRAEYSGRTFEVLGITDNWNGTFGLTLSEIRPQTWALDADSFTPLAPVVAPDLSYLWNVAPLTGFAVALSPAQLMPDGSGASRIALTWNLHAQAYVRAGGSIELRYRQVGTSLWMGIPPAEADSTGTQFSASLIDSAAYEFQARARNSLGAASAWASAYAVVDGEAVVTPSLRIKASSLLFAIDAQGEGSPAAIRLEPVLGGGLAGPVAWSVVAGAATLGVDGDARTLTYADMATDAVTIQASAERAGTLYTDLATILTVHDGLPGDPGAPGAPGAPGEAGADAVTAFLTRDPITLPADPSGAVTSYADATTMMIVFRGAVDDSGAWTYTRVLGPGVTTATLAGNVLTVSAVATGASAGYVDIIASHPTRPAITKRVNVGKVRQGAQGPPGNPGAAGARGSVQLATPRSGAGWSDAIANAAIVNAGYAGPQHLDMVTIYSTDQAWSEARAYMSGAWQPVAAYISGNMFVKGSLGAEAFGAKSITTDKLAVQAAYGTILNPDPGIEDPAAWTVTGDPSRQRFSLGQWGFFGRWGWQAYGSTQVRGPMTPVQRTKVYRVSARALRNAGSAARVYLFVAFFDAAGALIVDQAGWPGGGTFNYYGLINGYPSVDSWEPEYTQVFGYGQTARIPDNATHMAVGALLSWETPGHHSAVHGMRITEMVEGSVVVEGGLQARHVDLTGGHIKTSTYSGYGWPAWGQGGFYLGPEGLLMGNANGGTRGFLQLTADGQIWAPNFRIVGGQLTIDQIDVIKTVNIAGRAVTVPLADTRPTYDNTGIGAQVMLWGALANQPIVVIGTVGTYWTADNATTAVIQFHYGGVWHTLAAGSTIHNNNWRAGVAMIGMFTPTYTTDIVFRVFTPTQHNGDLARNATTGLIVMQAKR